MADGYVVEYICRLFATLLDYPTPGLPRQARECAESVAAFHRQAAENLRGFLAFLEQAPPGRWEEAYTGAFDLQPVCSPYLGYQLLGESYQRGEFMVELGQRYRAREFSPEGELPDHLAVVLRYLAVCPPGEREALLDGLLLPALQKMAEAFRGSENPYGKVLESLRLWLEGERRPASMLALSGKGEG